MRLLVLLMIALIMSCGSSDEVKDEYLVFGSYYGFCQGNCTSIYKIENGKLYEDNIEMAILDNLNFKSTALSDADYDLAKPLIDNLPSALQNSKEETIGCPDCYDQGEYLVEFNSGDGVKRLRIDTRLDEREYPEIVDYLERIREVLDQLNK